MPLRNGKSPANRRSAKNGANGRRASHPPSIAKAALPATRGMWVVAQDPGVRRADGSILMAKIQVPAEDLAAGPMGYRVQVVDYDTSAQTYHGRHDLPDEHGQPKAWAKGVPKRILSDYRFHAQNVYALVMKTLARFEYALGRRIGWSFDVHQLKVAPHGMMDANAFYSPDEEGLVFGYFPGQGGKTVYTCLSHDVVVHETSHALVDALRERYLDPSGPDQAAFHEGFADVIALLSVFTQLELVAELLSRLARKKKPHGFLADEEVSAKSLGQSILFGLAEEMGAEIDVTRGEALRRSVELKPNRDLLSTQEFIEPHRRGEVLVAAVMKGFLDVWTARLEHSKIRGQKLHSVTRVAEEGADIAACLSTMWIRALDYMPPVHLTFGDALSAALTADLEVRPDDTRYELRKHMLAAFRSFGIAPSSGEPGGVWRKAPGNLSYDRVRFDAMRTDEEEVFRFLWENRGPKRLNLRSDIYTKVLSVRPCVRLGGDGFVLRETVAEYYQVAYFTTKELRARGIDVPQGYVDALERAKKEKQNRRKRQLGNGAAATEAGGAGAEGDAADEARAEDEARADEKELTTPIYGGGVLIFDEYGKLKYYVTNDVLGDLQSVRLQYLWEYGYLEAGRNGAHFSGERLAALHRQRAIDSRHFSGHGW
jgi:hypothetical protein